MAESEAENFYISPEMVSQIEEGIAALPEKRREIFRLSREENFKYREIAEKLGISIKTVEVQMGLALKFLRSKIRMIYIFICFGKPEIRKSPHPYN